MLRFRSRYFNGCNEDVSFGYRSRNVVFLWNALTAVSGSSRKRPCQKQIIQGGHIFRRALHQMI